MYRYIIGMATEKLEIRRSVTDVDTKIDEHIIRLLLYPDSQYCNHWKKEIYAFLHEIKREKGNEKFSKYKDILRWLQESNDLLDNMITLVIEEESDLAPRKIDSSEILRCLETYQQWLAKQLSLNGMVSNKSIYSKLDEIVNSTLERNNNVV